MYARFVISALNADRIYSGFAVAGLLSPFSAEQLRWVTTGRRAAISAVLLSLAAAAASKLNLHGATAWMGRGSRATGNNIIIMNRHRSRAG